MTIEECKNNYFKQLESADLDEYCYKIVDKYGKKITSECRFKRIWDKWQRE